MAKTPVSIRSIARQVNTLTEVVTTLANEIAEDRNATNRNTERLNELNLNGSAPTVRALAKRADVIFAALDEKQRRDSKREAWATVRADISRWLNPVVSHTGKFFWAVVIGVVSLVIANRIG